MAKGRAKPLHGSKKYDKAILNCTFQILQNPERDKEEKPRYKTCGEEFYVSHGTTPARRFCKEHFGGSTPNEVLTAKRTENAKLRQALKVLGLIA